MMNLELTHQTNSIICILTTILVRVTLDNHLYLFYTLCPFFQINDVRIGLKCSLMITCWLKESWMVNFLFTYSRFSIITLKNNFNYEYTPTWTFFAFIYLLDSFLSSSRSHCHLNQNICGRNCFEMGVQRSL